MQAGELKLMLITLRRKYKMRGGRCENCQKAAKTRHLNGWKELRKARGFR